jgi:HAD superfamily hydrolase (TIGR01509 family)
MLIKAVIFDLDGVIVDTEGPHYRSVVTAFAQYGIQTTQSEYDNFILGKGPHLGLKCYIENVHPELVDKLDHLLELKRVAFREELERDILVFPDTFDILETLHGHFPLAVCSSLSKEEVGFSLSKTGLLKYFPVVISGDDVQLTKPNPQGFILAAKQTGVEPQHCLGVEDAVVGVEALRNAGMVCVAVTYTQSEELLREAKPDFLVDQLIDFDWERLIEEKQVQI